MINFLKKHSLTILTSTFVGFTLLSWILFFREERALRILEINYPFVQEFLLNSRAWLLRHFLNSAPTLLFIILVIISFFAYMLSLSQKFSPKKIIVYSILFQIILFFSYPVLSTDIFDYINSDRLAVVYKQNVWRVPPEKFPQDKFYPFINYPDLVRIYGPVNQVIYSGATSVSGDDIFVNLSLHKLVVFVFVLGSLAVISLTLKQFSPENEGRGLSLVFWNPLFVIETAGSGHNDILMLFFLLLAYFFFRSRKVFLSGLALALSVQVKTPALLLLPFLGIFFLQEKRIRDAISFSAAFVATYLLGFVSMGVSLSSVIARQGQTTNSFWQSFPLIVNRYTPFAPILKLCLLGVLIYQAWRVVKKADPWQTFVQTLFVYLLLFLPTLWNWYFLWVLVFLPFFSLGRFAAGVLGATFGSLLAYAIDWIRLRFGYTLGIWQVIMYGTILLSSISGAFYAFKTDKR